MKITAIITTYNSEKFIQRTIDSIMNQRKSTIDFEMEIIVVDDKSTDNTKNMATAYKSVVFFENNKNSGGPNKGRNIGLKMATGEYICIVDHDDEWLPTKISEQLKFLDENNLIVTSNYIQMDVQNNKENQRGNQSPDNYICYAKNETFLNKLAKNKTGEKAYIGSIIFHHSLKSILFEEKFGMVDFDWLLRLFKDNTSVEINKPLYRRYFYGSNLSLDEKYRQNDYEFSIQTVNDYKNVYPNIVRKSIKRINGSMARYYYIIGRMKEARYYFMKSECNAKTILYITTSFVGSRFVKKHFNVFG